METRTCRRCRIEKPLEGFVRNRRDPSGYANHCKACQALATRDWAARRALRGTISGRLDSGPINRQTERMTRQTLSQHGRRWGVEIEFFGCTPQAVCDALLRHGINCREEGYNHTVRTYWKLTTDGSVNYAGTGRSWAGLELVSPPLQGEDGLDQLQRVCTALAEAGAQVDKTCGTHIHHEARGLTVRAAANLIRNYSEARPIIDRVLAPSRRLDANQGRSFCASYEAHTLRHVDNATMIGDIADYAGRYRDVNFCAWGRQGTVEFRQHQGTVDYMKIASWAALTRSMLDQSLADATWGLVNTVTGLISNLGRNEDTSYWMRRERVLNPQTVAA